MWSRRKDQHKQQQRKIIVGTIGHSAAIDKIMKQRKNDMKQLKGKREMYVITIDNGQLVIAGSDRRGTIYGIYELSKQIGVSPWYYWADTPIEQHKHIYIKKVSIRTVNRP